MEGLITGACAQALQESRDALNAEFSIARRQWRRLDPEAFGEHVRDVIAPIVERVATHDPQAATPTLRTLYRQSLDLMGRGLMGPRARSLAINHLWRKDLVNFSAFLAKSPRQVSASLTNATHHLEQEGVLDPTLWLDKLTSFAGKCPTPEVLLECGQVLAWRIGMSHWRESALAHLANLPEDLGRTILDIPETDALPWDRVLELLHNPWIDFKARNEEQLEPIMSIGGFQGFGGPFSAPPTVHQFGGAIFVEDGRRCWSLHADQFGATLKLFGRDLPDFDPEPNEDAFTVSKAGIVRHQGLSTRSHVWANPASFETQGDLVAITHQHSYHIRMLVRRRLW